MKNSLLSNHSFKTRAKVSAGIVLLVILGALSPDAIGLRVLYSAAAAISALEILTLSALPHKTSLTTTTHGFLSMVILAFSVSSVFIIPRALLIIGIALTMASDSGAYLVGKICGTKLISSRPFPEISPNKSWEGTIGGLIIPGFAVPILNHIFQDSMPGRPLPIMLGCIAGLCAILGDVSASLLKRRYGAKDANDAIKDFPGLRRIEALLGGSEGHGGYYDRLDSLSAVMSMFGIATLFIGFFPNT